MTLNDFYTLARIQTNIANAADARIKSATRQAWRWLEQNFTLPHMKSVEVFDIPAANENEAPPIIDLRPDGKTAIADILYGRTYKAETPGQFRRFKKIDPYDLDHFPVRQPKHGYMIDDERLQIAEWSNEAWKLHLILARFTDFDALDPEQSHWLLENAEGVLLNRTMFFVGPSVRDADIMQAHKAIFDEGIKTLVLAQARLMASISDAEAQYGEDYDQADL